MLLAWVECSGGKGHCIELGLLIHYYAFIFLRFTYFDYSFLKSLLRNSQILITLLSIISGLVGLKIIQLGPNRKISVQGRKKLMLTMPGK